VLVEAVLLPYLLLKSHHCHLLQHHVMQELNSLDRIAAIQNERLDKEEKNYEQ